MSRPRLLSRLLTGLVLLGLIVGACSPPRPATAPPASTAPAGAPTSAGGEPTEITVWYFDRVSMETVIPLFEQRYPHIKVRFVHQPFGDMAKKYQAVLAARSNVPDVIGLDTSMVGRFLEAGENLLAPPYNAGQFRDQFVEWKFNAPIVNGEMTAFPWDVATGVMFYRVDVFQRAGLPTEPEEVAKALATWEDFLRAGRQVVEKTGGESFMIGHPHDLYNVAFWQNGGNIVVGDEIAFVREGREPLRLAIQAREAGISANIPAWSERWAPALKSGKIATVITGAWMLGNLQTWIDKEGAGRWRVAPAPGGAFNNGGTYLQIPKLAKNKAAAWEFIKFLTTTPEVQNAVFQRTGIVPAYKPAWNSPLYDQPVEYLGGQRVWRLLVDLAQQVKPLAYSPVDALGTDLMNAQVDLAIAGKVPPEQALETAARMLQERAARTNLTLRLGT